jgi:hypothetical protein
MPHRSAETATYPGEMARFEIEIPDDMLILLGNVAGDAGETAEECLSRIVREGLDRAGDAFEEKYRAMFESQSLDLGGRTAEELIREDRDHRDDKRFGPDDDAR